MGRWDKIKMVRERRRQRGIAALTFRTIFLKCHYSYSSRKTFSIFFQKWQTYKLTTFCDVRHCETLDFELFPLFDTIAQQRQGLKDLRLNHLKLSKTWKDVTHVQKQIMHSPLPKNNRATVSFIANLTLTNLHDSFYHLNPLTVPRYREPCLTQNSTELCK